MAYVAREDRRLQLFLRAASKSVIRDRDYLLGYTIGEFYNEMSLFIEETETKVRHLEEMRRKK